MIVNRICISSSALLLLALCRTASALDYQIEANIRYDHHPETYLDVLQPSAPALGDRPGVIVVLGGGGVQGDKERMLEEYCLPFVRHGMVVAYVEYRLAKAAAPEAVSDVLKAARWFYDHAVKYKVDRKRILAAGASGSGHLALMTAMTPASADLGPLKIAAVIDFFGDVSPISQVRKGLPPILALHGDADPLVPYEQSVALVKALKSAGDDAELITVTEGKHGFPPQEMDQLWPQIFKWLKKHKIG